MKKSEYTKMILGVIIGTLGTLLLTLNFWGDGWYQITCSIATGVILGMFITDYKLARQIIINVCNDGAKFIYRIIYMDNRKDEIKSIAALAETFELFLKIIFFIIPVVGMICLLSLFGPSYALLRILGFIAFIIFWSYFIHNIFLLSLWDEKLSDNQKIILWGGVDMYFKNDSFFNVVDYEHYAEHLPPSRIRRAIFQSIMICLPLVIISYLKKFAFLVTSILAVLFIAVPLSPFWLIKEIGKYGKMMAVSGSIVVGGLVGTMIHSYFYGIGTGVLMCSMCLILSLFRKIDMFPLFRKNHILANMWE